MIRLWIFSKDVKPPVLTFAPAAGDLSRMKRMTCLFLVVPSATRTFVVRRLLAIPADVQLVEADVPVLLAVGEDDVAVGALVVGEVPTRDGVVGLGATEPERDALPLVPLDHHRPVVHRPVAPPLHRPIPPPVPDLLFEVPGPVNRGDAELEISVFEVDVAERKRK